MRLHLIWIACVLGCGSVAKTGNDAATTDAVIADVATADVALGDGATDGSNVCTVHDTIDSCGAMCTKCPAGRERTMPSCDGRHRVRVGVHRGRAEMHR